MDLTSTIPKFGLTSFISPCRWTEALNTRKLLQSANQKEHAKDFISPAPALRKHGHHHHPKNHTSSALPQAPSTLPLPKPLVHTPKPDPKHIPVNHTVPFHHSSRSVKPPSAEAISKWKHVRSWHVYASVIGGVSFLLAMSVVLFVCIRTKKVVAVRPWATGLSGQLQKAFVKGTSLLIKLLVILGAWKCDIFWCKVKLNFT
jgi:hypothetical protein